MQKEKNYSIEYAHIYSNQEIGQEQEFAKNILKDLVSQLSGELSLVVMVDDYSFPDPSFDYQKLSDWAKDQSIAIDIIFRESQLIPVCDLLLKEVADIKLKSQITSYIKSNKYPCSLFIASWYLLRLGKIQHPLFPERLVAKKLVNILPESFRSFEEKAFDIIAVTPYCKSLDQIENRYFEGRLIA